MINQILSNDVANSEAAFKEEINKLVQEALDAYNKNDNDTVGCILDYIELKTASSK